MTPALTVLQLDTQFPRIPGDVGCAGTYQQPVEVLRIPKASVGAIVSDDPASIDIGPFEQADLMVTSCGFLSFWQDHLAKQTGKTFISSALIALEDLSKEYAPGEIMIVTFDAKSLTRQHLGRFVDYASGIVGLPESAHLRHVIEQNQSSLDQTRAGATLVELVAGNLREQHKHILLECTNLPPYKAQLQAATGRPITDILTLIESAKPGTVKPQFISEARPKTT